MRARAAALVLAAGLAGCGTDTADLMAIEVSGGPANADARIRVTDDGRATCGGRELRAIPSQTVLDARGVKRSLRPLAKRGASFRAGATGGRSYVVRSFDGVVRWTEGAEGPPALGRAALFTLRLERLLCRRRG
jgi:hypothetical protein